MGLIVKKWSAYILVFSELLSIKIYFYIKKNIIIINIIIIICIKYIIIKINITFDLIT